MTNSELPVSGPGTCARFSAPKPVGPRAAGVVEREVEGCFALLCADGDRVLVLNETASDLWRLIDGDLTLDVIVDLLFACIWCRTAPHLQRCRANGQPSS